MNYYRFLSFLSDKSSCQVVAILIVVVVILAILIRAVTIRVRIGRI
jgi:hypothetical protein